MDLVREAEAAALEKVTSEGAMTAASPIVADAPPSPEPAPVKPVVAKPEPAEVETETPSAPPARRAPSEPPREVTRSVAPPVAAPAGQQGLAPLAGILLVFAAALAALAVLAR